MLYVDTLTVSAFRGIPGEVTVRLDAPLTLLYAPNGIGKTTLCDSIEWLLTESVDRLASLQGDSYRCKHAKREQRTRVTASVRMGNEHVTLRRDWQKPSVTAESMLKAVTWTPTDLLDWLVPQVASEFADARSRNPRRKEWLRATHFLASERLALLMDSDEGNRTRREQVFADLLGVGQLQRLVPRFEKAVKAATRQKEDSALEAGKCAGRVAEIHQQLKRSGSTGGLDAIREAITRAIASLGGSVVDEPIDMSDRMLSETLRHITAVATQQKLDADRCLPAWNTLREWLAFEQGRGASVNEQREQVDTLSRQRTEVARRLNDARHTLAQRSATKKERAAELLRLDQEISELRTAVPALKSLAEQERMPRAAIQDLLQKAAENVPTDMDQLASVADTLKHSLAAATDCATQLADVEARLAAMPVEATLVAELDRVTGVFRSRKEQEQNLKAAWDSIASLEQQMSRLGREFIERHASSGRCPLCTHDWQSVAGLQAAISRASAVSTSNMSTKDASLTDAQNAATEAEHSVVAARAAIAARKELSGTLQGLHGQLQPIWRCCELLGLPVGQLPEMTQVEICLAQIRTRRAGAEAARRVERLLGERATEKAEQNWQASLDAAIRRRESQRPEAIAEISRLDPELPALSAAITLDEEAMGVVNTRLAEAEQRIAEATAMEQKRDAAAASLALGKPLSRDIIETSMNAWETTREQCDQVLAILRSASESLMAVEWRKQSEEAQAAMQTARSRQAAAGTRVDQLDQLEKLLHAHLTAAKKQRVGSLCAAVEALFFKMHAARIAESVEATSDLSGFSVRIGEWMSNAEQLSQGQRQDLALSIFLARARAYGGTFFMDEPLLHLDDLNRVALLDALRAIAIQDGPRVCLVATTASSVVLTHLRQKCRGIKAANDQPIMRAYQLSGTVRDNVEVFELDV